MAEYSHSSDHTKRAQEPLRIMSIEDMAFASLSLWIHHRDTESKLAKAFTDGKHIFYGPDFETLKENKSFESNEKIGVCAHEILHISNCHVIRGQALKQRFGGMFRPFTFNIATDAIINTWLKSSGYAIPSNGIFLDKVLTEFLGLTKEEAEDALAHWSAERLYIALQNTKVKDLKKKGKKCKSTEPGAGQKQQGDKGQQDDDGQNGQDQGDQDGQGGEGEDENGQNGQGQGKNSQKGKGQQKGNGQGQDDQDDDGQDQDDDQNGQGKPRRRRKKDDKGQGKGQGGDDDVTVADVLEEWAKGQGYEGDLDLDGEPMSEAEASEKMGEWQNRMARAISESQKAGRGIGMMGHKVADIPKSKTPWERILRTLVQKAVTRQPRPSWARPTRSFLARDSHASVAMLPRPVYEQGVEQLKGVPRIVVGVDVSGSINDVTLQKFCGEIARIGRTTGAEIEIMVFDTQVLNHVVMPKGLMGKDLEEEIKKVEFARGGGTCFKDIIDKADQRNASAIVVLTDLYAGFGKAPKTGQVIWAIEAAQPPCQVPFGRVVSMAA